MRWRKAGGYPSLLRVAPGSRAQREDQEVGEARSPNSRRATCCLWKIPHGYPQGADLEGLKNQIADTMVQGCNFPSNLIAAFSLCVCEALQAHAEELKIFVENQLSQVTLLLSGSQVEQRYLPLSRLGPEILSNQNAARSERFPKTLHEEKTREAHKTTFNPLLRSSKGYLSGRSSQTFFVSAAFVAGYGLSPVECDVLRAKARQQGSRKQTPLR
eukprot:755748-Hanusia_phi.AAC.3